MYTTEHSRLIYCRSLLNKTRKEICEEWGIASIPTLVRWEQGTVDIPRKKVNAILNYFKKNGLIVNADWLRTGTGVPPINLNLSTFSEETFDDIANEIFLKINSKIKDFFINKLANNFCAPMLRYGDYVGGVELKSKENFNHLINKFIFAFTDTEGTVGFLTELDANKVNLKNFENSNKHVQIKDILHFGEVQWTARRP